MLKDVSMDPVHLQLPVPSLEALFIHVAQRSGLDDSPGFVLPGLPWS